MLIVDSFIYAILVWYIEAVYPGEFGIPRPWYFPFQLSYWFGSNANCDLDCCSVYKRLRWNRQNTEEPPNTDALLAMEAEPQHLKLGVFIDNLVKKYKKNQRPAVDHLTLNLYEGQITSFLGHNGAGKTTTMSLLTGLFPPSAGTAYIYGHNIHSEMDKIRRSLGLCPQHNVLYGRLTVEEHLWFYARLKGMPANQVKEEMKCILEDVGLPDKRHSPVDTLSGGMKRKLSVAMAFVGGSRTVILDEPTAGVDPYARRAIWELLGKYKDGRTILLSTHFMDEADILGDRIAIISHGKLRCCGTSMFLKKKFGDGYHLTVVKETDIPDSAKKISPEVITKFIQDYIPSAQLICETHYELSYVLPDKGKERKGMLRQLFENLERNKVKLQCKSFGLQDTTLEEVFLKVTEAPITGEEQGLSNELTTAVEIPLSPISSEEEAPGRNRAADISTHGNGSNLSNGNSKPKKIINKHPGHRRSFSSDLIERKRVSKPTAVTCAHRRTPSGGFCGHRRSLSTDLQLALQNSTPQIPSKHKRTPSGVSKLRPVGSGSWQMNTGINTVNSYLWRWMQFYALLIKRVHHTRRNKKALLTQILLPALFVSIAMTVALAQPKADTYPPLVLSPTMFHPPPYYIPYSNTGKDHTGMAKRMEETFKLASGIGSDCVLRYKDSSIREDFVVSDLRKDLLKYFDDFCYKQVGKSQPERKPLSSKSYYINTKANRKDKNPKCKCDTKYWKFVCDKDVEGHPNITKTVTMDTLLRIYDQKIDNYLLYTSNKYRRMRYGALTFGDVQNIVPETVEQNKYSAVKKLFARHTARVWFSNKGYHAMPTFINAMNNAILRASIPWQKENPAAYGITAITHPFNFTKNVLNFDAIRQGTDAVIAIFVIISMSFVPASFVVFLVMERNTKAKHIQFVSGVNPVLYWLSNLIWDLINFLIPATACMIIFHIFNVPAYASHMNFPAVCALFLGYGWSITPMMYPFSFIFKEASTAYVVLIILNLFLGMTPTIATLILQQFPDDSQLQLAYHIVKTVALLIPNFCLGRGLMDLAYNELMNQIYGLSGQFDSIRSPFEWDVGITKSLISMFVEGIFFFVLTIFMEWMCTLRRNTKLIMEDKLEGEDADVAAERQRVLSGGAEDDLLRMENLTKVYNSRKTGKHLAVDRLCVGISRGECFGLLGVNGAGKTTTFKMLSGDTKITAGEAFIENCSVVKDVLKVHKKIGYCPQFDALIDSLTAEEQLYLYARLKGIPETEIKEVCQFLIQKMALTRYAKQPSKTYSGGNKRKLSAAIALLGNPSVIFMDEPTTGMDPGARRFLWNIILSVVQQGTKSVVLTSHSMEECEALCTRLAIMVNGQFRCLGSTQHIKNKFGDGYIVIIRVKGSQPNMSPVENFMEEQFQEAILKERHHNVLQYQIPSADNISLSFLFGKMEQVVDELDIEDYSVSQTSLDNVFVNFAKYQRDATVERDPSFLHISSASRRGSPIKTRLRKIKQRLSQIEIKKRRTEFTPLVQLPPIETELTEPIGNIGLDEEEVGLNEEESYLFPVETTRLTFNV